MKNSMMQESLVQCKKNERKIEKKRQVSNHHQTIQPQMKHTSQIMHMNEGGEKKSSTWVKSEQTRVYYYRWWHLQYIYFLLIFLIEKHQFLVILQGIGIHVHGLWQKVPNKVPNEKTFSEKWKTPAVFGKKTSGAKISRGSRQTIHLRGLWQEVLNSAHYEKTYENACLLQWIWDTTPYMHG